MIRRYVFLVLFILLNVLPLSSHPWKPSHFVVVETDGGVDDLRSIILMLASPDVQVMGIVCSHGVLPAETVWIKVRSLLDGFHHGGLPVSLNRGGQPPKKAFPLASGILWGPEEGLDGAEAGEYQDMLRSLLKHSTDSITYISLGSLEGIHTALADLPELESRLNAVYWTANADTEQCFNYQLAPEEAERMLDSSLPLTIVNPGGAEGFYTTALHSLMKDMYTPYARVLYRLMPSWIQSGHDFALGLYDEMIPLFLHAPHLFQTRDGTLRGQQPREDIALHDSLQKWFLLCLEEETVNQHQVIRRLPLEADFYFEDLGPRVDAILQAHGKDEFESAVITNELHRHLGVYSIIGVKMGILAREYFVVGVDQLEVESLAGLQPPLSCMNDGLQVSTGATLGHGLIRIANTGNRRPAARFRYHDRRIEIRLLPEIAERISAELQEINFIYGLNSNTYWELVRRNALLYWQTFDRHEIFLLEEIP